MTETSTDVVRVVHQQDEHRYVVCVNGQEAGHAKYQDQDQLRVFIHTEVDPEFSGQGLAVKLVNKALKNTVESGKRIVPVCSFVVSFAKRHPELTEHIVKPTPSILNALTK